MKRALLYRRGGLGDTLLTFPILEILKRKGYHVTAVGNTDYLKIALEVGWADDVVSEIPVGNWDRKIIFSLDYINPFPKRREWIVSYLLREAGFEGERFSKVLPIEPLPKSPFEGKAVLHPSSGSPKKNPHIDLFLEVHEFLERRGIEVAYLVGEADSWVKSSLPYFVESLDPLWIAKAGKSALLYIGLDSGISHLFSYLGVPSVVIYGPTDPILWKPIGERVFQVVPDLECNPCFPYTCSCRGCLDKELILKSLLPLLDHLLVKINQDNLL